MRGSQCEYEEISNRYHGARGGASEQLGQGGEGAPSWPAEALGAALHLWALRLFISKVSSASAGCGPCPRDLEGERPSALVPLHMPHLALPPFPVALWEVSGHLGGSPWLVSAIANVFSLCHLPIGSITEILIFYVSQRHRHSIICALGVSFISSFHKDAMLTDQRL